MVTLGIILLIATAVLSADIVMENAGHTDVVVLGQVLSFDVWGLFALGAAVGVVVVFGLQLTAHGIVRTGRRRRQLRQLVRDADVGEYRSEPDDDELAVDGREPEPAPARAAAGPYDRVVARVGGTGPRRGESRGANL